MPRGKEGEGCGGSGDKVLLTEWLSPALASAHHLLWADLVQWAALGESQRLTSQLDRAPRIIGPESGRSSHGVAASPAAAMSRLRKRLGGDAVQLSSRAQTGLCGQGRPVPTLPLLLPGWCHYSSLTLLNNMNTGATSGGLKGFHFFLKSDLK